MAESQSNYDSPWKEALEQYFPHFMQLLAPHIHEQIDWSEPITFLDSEFQAINHGSVNGKRYADKLVEVRGKDNAYFWILVHVEIQGGRVTPRRLTQFSKRMYQYNYRIHDHHGEVLFPTGQRPQAVGLISLGVLTAGKGPATPARHPGPLQYAISFPCRILSELARPLGRA